MWYCRRAVALQSKNGDSEPLDMEELLNDLGHRLDRLKQLYEMYFLGIEKMEPGVARKEVQRTMLMLQQQNIRNTGLRFKLNALVQKWNIYQTYWGRTVREMENGTYVRHLQRMRRNAERDGKELPAEVVKIRERLLAGVAAQEQQAAPKAAEKPSSGYDEFDSMKNFLDDETGGFPRVEEDDLQPPSRPVVAAPPARPPAAAPPPPPRATVTTPPPLPGAPRTTAPPRPPTPPLPPGGAPPVPRPAVPTPPRGAATTPPGGARPNIPGMNESELRALHQSYVAARQSSGENAKVSYEGLVGSLQKQLPRILEQPGVKGVKFEVTTKDGKAIVKAIPQK